MRSAFILILIVVAVTGCKEGDAIQPTKDPCVFLLDFATRCTPAGKTAICSRKPPVIVRSEAPDCARDKP